MNPSSSFHGDGRYPGDGGAALEELWQLLPWREIRNCPGNQKISERIYQRPERIAWISSGTLEILKAEVEFKKVFGWFWKLEDLGNWKLEVTFATIFRTTTWIYLDFFTCSEILEVGALSQLQQLHVVINFPSWLILQRLMDSWLRSWQDRLQAATQLQTERQDWGSSWRKFAGRYRVNRYMIYMYITCKYM